VQLGGGYGMGGMGGGYGMGGMGGGYGMGGVDVMYNYDGSVTIEPEMINMQPPMGMSFTTQPTFYNGIGYYWHHGGWWRHPHTHPYFNHPTFYGWYQNRYGGAYQGFDYYNSYHHRW